MTSILSLQIISGIRAKYLEIFQSSGNQLVGRILDEINEMKFEALYLAAQPMLTQTNGSVIQQLAVLNNFMNLGESKYSSVAIYNSSGYKILETGGKRSSMNIPASKILATSAKDTAFFNSTSDELSDNQRGFHVTVPLYNNQSLFTGVVDVRVSDNFVYSIFNNTAFSLNEEGDIYKFTIDIIQDNGNLIFSSRTNISANQGSKILTGNYSGIPDKFNFNDNPHPRCLV